MACATLWTHGALPGIYRVALLDEGLSHSIPDPDTLFGYYPQMAHQVFCSESLDQARNNVQYTSPVLLF
jgi:hypothetical protein